MPKAEVTETGVTITWSSDEVNLDVARLLATCDIFNSVTTEEVPYEKGVCGAFYPDWTRRDSVNHNKVSCTNSLNHDARHYYRDSGSNHTYVW